MNLGISFPTYLELSFPKSIMLRRVYIHARDFDGETKGKGEEQTVYKRNLRACNFVL